MGWDAVVDVHRSRLAQRLLVLAGMAAVKSLRALIVEDDDCLRNSLLAILTSEGITAIAESTGRGAIRRAVKDDFDVVFTDLGLPDIPGTVIIHAILATPSARRPRVVVITAAEESEIENARHAGADVVFRKPFDLDAILCYLATITPSDSSTRATPARGAAVSARVIRRPGNAA